MHYEVFSVKLANSRLQKRLCTTALVSTETPFRLHSLGRYKLSPGFESFSFITDFVQCLWCTGGEGIIMMNRQERVLRSGCAAFYLPGMHHFYHSRNQWWNMIWFAIDGPLAASILTAFGFAAEIYPVGRPPMPLFRALEKSIQSSARAAAFRSAEITFQLLSHMAQRLSPDQKHGDPLAKLVIDKIHVAWNSPGLNIKTLSSDLHQNRFVITRRFKKAIGIVPSAYIHQLRLQHAVTMLKSTHEPLGNIARACGFTDSRYLSRLLRRKLGVTPDLLRNNPEEKNYRGA